MPIMGNYGWMQAVLRLLLPGSGATGERPQNVLAGFCYFDKTINKPVWWNGSSWTDASGATV